MAIRHDTRRRFEQWAKNPDCEANTISAVAGVDMAKVATAEGLESSMGQSPFALARGVTFERRLFEDRATRLYEALVEANLLPQGASGLADFRMRMNGGPMKDLDSAAEATRKMLVEVAERGAGCLEDVPNLAAAATLTVPGQPVMLPDGKVAIDALLLRPDQSGDLVEVVIGEVKTYPFRAGNTEADDLATSRAQAGVYLHALRLVVDELGLDDRVVLSSTGFLVLTKSGRNDPAILPAEDLEFQARRAARGFERLRQAAIRLDPFDPEKEDAAIDAVRNGALAYRPSCLGFCDRAPGCRHRAEETGDGAILGDDVKRFLGSVPLPRAIELLHGAEPGGEAEVDLQLRMRSVTSQESM